MQPSTFQLDASQQAAVQYDAPPLLIIGATVSGKSEIIARRMARAAAALPERSGQVLALTFTSRSAAILQQRVEALALHVQARSQRIDRPMAVYERHPGAVCSSTPRRARRVAPRMAR